MKADIFEIPGPARSLFEVACDAAIRGLHLIHDGRSIVVSPIVPPGWRRVAVVIKDAYEQTDATAGCCDIDTIILRRAA